jgi:Ni,Fe-hydrogenase III large subunit/Ni,Fe-hydrogenase III component G
MAAANPFDGLGLDLAPVRSAVPAWRTRIAADSLRDACIALAARDGRLVALWGSDERDRDGGFALHLTVAVDGVLLWLSVPLPEAAPRYPDLSDVFLSAGRMQRATHDLLGIRATAPDPIANDQRPWLRHAAWPIDVFPLRRDVPLSRVHENGLDDYAFVAVAGDGVHEIPVGPVHAGTIEPGHFRFSIVGEKVLRLEERLGYKHKAIDKLFEGRDLLSGSRLAGRVSGDSTVAFAWAYAMAVEGLARIEPPPRALWLRALALERERIANHLGDLGYLGNDGGLAFGLAQFMRLKEDVLRLNAELFGHRYLMDYVVPGGVARNAGRHGCDQLAEQCDALEREVQVLKDIYDDHAGLQDRFLTCGRLSPELAKRLGVVGFAARASGQSLDLRAQPAFEPYDRLGVAPHIHEEGDVAARVTVRFEEIFESLRLVRMITADLPLGEIAAPFETLAGPARGIGRVEGWRGEAMVALEAEGGVIRRCHAHDPSWQNWPALEHAILGNIVPDFPLINKSFNLSYAGQDL